MKCILIEVTVCDRPPFYVHSYRQKRIIVSAENPMETMVITIFQEHFTAWVEKIPSGDYARKHNAEFIRWVDVSQDVIDDAKRIVEHHNAITAIRERQFIQAYEVFAQL